MKNTSERAPAMAAAAGFALVLVLALLVSQSEASSRLLVATNGAASTDSASGAPSATASSSSGARFKPFRPWPKDSGTMYAGSKAFEGSSEFVHMKYHMGPVLSPKMHVYIVWYGAWKASEKQIIKDFMLSISARGEGQAHSHKNVTKNHPTVRNWWNTVRLYTDQTGHNISDTVLIAREHDAGYSHGHSLTRMSVQQVLKSALSENNGTLPVNSHGGLYLLLTAEDVEMQEFCRAVCGFHYFTFPSIVGYTLPYAWIGNSGKQCPDVCAYPFAIPSYMQHTEAMKPPNGNVGIDGMISVIGHELAEMSSNPLINAWYAGTDPTAPTEIADLCEGMYGTGAGGGYAGSVLTDERGANYNLIGVHGRKFLVQWIWRPDLNACFGPNAQD